MAALGLGACGEEPVAPLPVIDAGTICERGTESCACTASGGCRQGLLCISRRCLPSQGGPSEPPSEPPVRPLPPPRQPPPASDGGADDDGGSDAAVSGDVDSGFVPPLDAAPTNAPGDAPGALDATTG